MNKHIATAQIAPKPRATAMLPEDDKPAPHVIMKVMTLTANTDRTNTKLAMKLVAF